MTTSPTKPKEAYPPDISSEPSSEERASRRGLYWSRILRAAKAIIVEFARYGPTSELYLIQTHQQECTASNRQDRWLTDDAGAGPTFHDPYGLISRWKVQQEIGNQAP